MIQPKKQLGFDDAAYRARMGEDVIVGGEIVRHRLSSRLIHWWVALSCLFCLLTGLPIWIPIYSWMANVFGGLALCRVLHPFFGVSYFLAQAAMHVHWSTDMKMSPRERKWVGPKLLEYLRDEANHADIGKYNGGQKVYFNTAFLAGVGLLLSGIVLWFPTTFPLALRGLAILLHEVSFLALLVSLVFHVYLATVAEPGTFNAMMRGTVSKAWARIHHPRWYREVLEGKKIPSSGQG